MYYILIASIPCIPCRWTNTNVMHTQFKRAKIQMLTVILQQPYSADCTDKTVQKHNEQHTFNLVYAQDQIK